MFLTPESSCEAEAVEPMAVRRMRGNKVSIVGTGIRAELAGETRDAPNTQHAWRD